MSPWRGPNPVRFSTCTIAASSFGTVAAEVDMVMTATISGRTCFIAWLDRRTIDRLHDKTCRCRGGDARPYPRRDTRDLERRPIAPCLREVLRGSGRDAVGARAPQTVCAGRQR